MRNPPLRRRLDAEIFAAVRHALDDDPAFAGSVRAHVKDGTVTLTGSVRTAADRSRAEKTVQRVEGVRGIVNEIFVANIPEIGFGYRRSDHDHLRITSRRR